MLKPVSRRSFVKSASITSAAWLGSGYAAKALPFLTAPPQNELFQLSRSLLNTWITALLELQITDSGNTTDYGGIISPANGKVHGRVADTIYPLLHLAHQTQKSKYVDAAVLLYEWMERNVSQPDGSWLNEPVKGSWKGTTVFTIIALCEALHKHGAVLDTQFKARIIERLKKAGEYIYNTFTIEYGNINYPINAAYALTLLGDLLGHKPYTEKGRLFAHQSLACFTHVNHFLYGEGSLKASAKGCLPIDLGYNVEESLPALVMYGLHTKDEEVLQMVTQSMQTHLEFMLPDGAWDNSWGTRNYKWTYWGSRTTDGSQAAYALLAHHDARFYKAALQNTKLLAATTHKGLLTGGPHYALHNVKTSVHHTFCHAKALTSVLDYSEPTLPFKSTTRLPREENYGYKFYPEIQTYLIAKADFKATITGYNCEYKSYKAGHATGGALTMLWHPLTGPVLAGSINEYQLLEADNMQPDIDPHSMSLTPRIELRLDGKLYSNINDLSARMEVSTKGDTIKVNTYSKLVNRDQVMCPSGNVECRATYLFTPHKVCLHFEHDAAELGNLINVILPVIASLLEKASLSNSHQFIIHKEKAMVRVKADQPIELLPATNGRIFNYVPGLEAIPLRLKSGAMVEIDVIKST